jgi:hypothetical protein
MLDQKKNVVPHHLVIALFVISIFALTSCASTFTTVLPRLPEKYEKIGPASGKACGSLLIDGTAYNFIPVLLNDRVERAYKNAVASVPSATALVNVTMQENWFWWVIGSTKCVTITGEAIR